MTYKEVLESTSIVQLEFVEESGSHTVTVWFNNAAAAINYCKDVISHMVILRLKPTYCLVLLELSQKHLTKKLYYTLALTHTLNLEKNV